MNRDKPDDSIHLMDPVSYLKMLPAAVRIVKRCYLILQNYWGRPKLDLQVKHKILVFKNKAGLDEQINYPCLIVTFKEDVSVNIRSIKLNNESLMVIFQKDPKFSSLTSTKEGGDSYACPIYSYVANNWLMISQGDAPFKIRKNEPLKIPLYLAKENSHCLFNESVGVKLLYAGEKICLKIEIERKEYHYGIDKLEMCKVVINWLAFRS